VRTGIAASSTSKGARRASTFERPATVTRGGSGERGTEALDDLFELVLARSFE
jgi:hypothetical protein